MIDYIDYIERVLLLNFHNTQADILRAKDIFGLNMDP